MTADEVLSRLQGVTKTGSGWAARCPGHEDKTASLSLAEGHDGRAVANQVEDHVGDQVGPVDPARPVSLNSHGWPS